MCGRPALRMVTPTSSHPLDVPAHGVHDPLEVVAHLLHRLQDPADVGVQRLQRGRGGHRLSGQCGLLVGHRSSGVSVPTQYPRRAARRWPTCDDGRMSGRHRKQSAAAPPGYFAWEATGLRWLAEARPTGGGGWLSTCSTRVRPTSTSRCWHPAHRPRRRPSGWGGGSPPPTRPARRPTAADHRAGSVTAGSARSPSRCPSRWASGRRGGRSTRRRASRRCSARRSPGGPSTPTGSRSLERLATRVADGAFDTGEPPGPPAR